MEKRTLINKSANLACVETNTMPKKTKGEPLRVKKAFEVGSM